VPTRLLGEAIYARKLAAAELLRRIERAYRPYHDLLAGLAAEQRRRCGASLVLDCHSMPTLPPMTRGEAPIDVALGDRFGRSCHPRLMEIAERTLGAAGLRVARNRPYAGGYITERHGRPGRGSHALQLELRRSLFMDERSHAPHDGLAMLQDLLRELVEALGAALLALPRPTARPADRTLRSA
jgi:N-formylglutamate amidohydrolase